MEFIENLNISWLIGIICVVGVIMTFFIIVIGTVLSIVRKRKRKAALEAMRTALEKYPEGMR